MTLWLLQVRPKNDLQPSQVNAPKWNPAAGSSQTLHIWFCIGSKRSNYKKKKEKKILGRLLLVGYLLVRKIRVLISIFGIGIALV